MRPHQLTVSAATDETLISEQFPAGAKPARPWVRVGQHRERDLPDRRAAGCPVPAATEEDAGGSVGLARDLSEFGTGLRRSTSPVAPSTSRGRGDHEVTRVRVRDFADERMGRATHGRTDLAR
jgi:hypothetical protein